MNTHLIKLPDIIFNEFIKSLRKGQVLVHGVGTFSVTEYRKKSHPSLLPNVDGKEYSMKAKKVTRISFKPHKDLKLSI